MRRAERVTWRKQHLAPLTTIEPTELNGLGKPGEYQEVILAVDSGASETVIEEDTLPLVQAHEGPAQKRGVKYEVANGEYLDNKGEKTFIGETEEGTLKTVTAQVCNVNRNLLSVSKVVRNNCCVMFHPGGSYIQDLTTGGKTWLKDDGGAYTLSLWVKNPSF